MRKYNSLPEGEGKKGAESVYRETQQNFPNLGKELEKSKKLTEYSIISMQKDDLPDTL